MAKNNGKIGENFRHYDKNFRHYMAEMARKVSPLRRKSMAKWRKSMAKMPNFFSPIWPSRHGKNREKNNEWRMAMSPQLSKE